MSDKLADRPNVNRRSLLLGAAGALASAGIPWPPSAAARALSAAAQPRASFDPVLAGKLERALHDAVRAPGARFPGAILHAGSPRLGRWTGAAGLGCVAPAIPMRGVDRFRAGSIVKPFVSVVVLQLAEERRLSLDTRLPAVLPASVVRRVTAPRKSPSGCCSATAAASRSGTSPPSTGRSRAIPRRCGRSRSSSISPPSSLARSRLGRATRTRTPTTRCWAP